MRYSFTYYWNAQRDNAGRPVGFFDGYLPGHRLEIAYRGLVEVAEITRTRDLLDLFRAAETLFVIFNDDARRPTCYHGPSMSVGSVVEVQGVCLTVASYGFERVEIWQSEIGLCNPQWISTAPCPQILR